MRFTVPSTSFRVVSIHDVDVWMSASRPIRLNASKTQVLWLGSRHNIDRLTVHEVPVLSSTVVYCRLSTRPRRCHWQPVVNGRPPGVSLPLSIHRQMYAEQIRPTYAVFVTWRCKDISPGVHLQSPGLLQLSFVRRHRQVNHADWSPWTHLTCSAGIALAACPTPCRLQTGNTDVKVATRLRTVVSLRRVQVSARGQSPSPLVWRQVVWCRRTAALEQAVCFTAVIWRSLPIQKTVENVFVCQGLGCGA